MAGRDPGRMGSQQAAEEEGLTPVQRLRQAEPSWLRSGQTTTLFSSETENEPVSEERGGIVASPSIYRVESRVESRAATGWDSTAQHSAVQRSTWRKLLGSFGQRGRGCWFGGELEL